MPLTTHPQDQPSSRRKHASTEVLKHKDITVLLRPRLVHSSLAQGANARVFLNGFVVAEKSLMREDGQESSVQL